MDLVTVIDWAAFAAILAGCALVLARMRRAGSGLALVGAVTQSLLSLSWDQPGWATVWLLLATWNLYDLVSAIRAPVGAR